MTDQQRQAIEMLERRTPVTETCRILGIERTDFYKWLKDDEEFKQRIIRSNLADLVTFEDVLFVKAISGNSADRRLYNEIRRGAGKNPREAEIEAVTAQLEALKQTYDPKEIDRHYAEFAAEEEAEQSPQAVQNNIQDAEFQELKPTTPATSTT